MGNGLGLSRLYDEFAEWFHLLTTPADYAEEAAFYRRLIVAASASPPRTLLELGAGGGNGVALQAVVYQHAR